MFCRNFDIQRSFSRFPYCRISHSTLRVRFPFHFPYYFQRFRYSLQTYVTIRTQIHRTLWRHHGRGQWVHFSSYKPTRTQTASKMFGGFNMFHDVGRPFNNQYKCFSVALLPGNERADVERGGKIIMPPSALDQLTRLNIVYPMLFKLTNKKTKRETHCGVLEFVADEGKGLGSIFRRMETF